MMYEAEIVSKGDGRYAAKTRHSHFEMGSNGLSSSPADVLLASLCACLGHYTGDFLAEQRIAFTDYVVSARAQVTDDGTRFGDIGVKLKIKDVRWHDPAQIEALRSYITRCFIYNTLKANSRISLDVDR